VIVTGVRPSSSAPSASAAVPAELLDPCRGRKEDLACRLVDGPEPPTVHSPGEVLAATKELGTRELHAQGLLNAHARIHGRRGVRVGGEPTVARGHRRTPVHPHPSSAASSTADRATMRCISSHGAACCVLTASSWVSGSGAPRDEGVRHHPRVGYPSSSRRLALRGGFEGGLSDNPMIFSSTSGSIPTSDRTTRSPQPPILLAGVVVSVIRRQRGNGRAVPGRARDPGTAGPADPSRGVTPVTSSTRPLNDGFACLGARRSDRWTTRTAAGTALSSRTFVKPPDPRLQELAQAKHHPEEQRVLDSEVEVHLQPH
jgi:hypothetical protein